MSIHKNIAFYGEWTKIIYQLSSNTHLIYSSNCDNANYLYPPQTVFVGGYTVFTLSNRLCVRNVLFP